MEAYVFNVIILYAPTPKLKVNKDTGILSRRCVIAGEYHYGGVGGVGIYVPHNYAEKWSNRI